MKLAEWSRRLSEWIAKKRSSLESTWVILLTWIHFFKWVKWSEWETSRLESTHFTCFTFSSEVKPSESIESRLTSLDSSQFTSFFKKLPFLVLNNFYSVFYSDNLPNIYQIIILLSTLQLFKVIKSTKLIKIRFKVSHSDIILNNLF